MNVLIALWQAQTFCKVGRPFIGASRNVVMTSLYNEALRLYISIITDGYISDEWKKIKLKGCWDIFIILIE